jgi:enoyl-CoA hydratase
MSSEAVPTPLSLPVYETLLVEEPRPGIIVVTLNRPGRLNALSFLMFEELAAVCRWTRTEDSVRVVVLTGAGRGFCSGLDLMYAERLAHMTPQEMLAGQETWADAIGGFRMLPTPVIAAVNGAAAGAGFSLALAADIRIAAKSARFSAAFVRIGLSGGDVGTSWMLPRIVGLGHAAQIMLTGRLYDTDYAERIGLVNEVVADDKILEAALDLASEIATNSPFGMRLTKQVLQTNVDAPSLQAALELENRNQVLTTRTADMSEALEAFLQKRDARFTGR